MRRILAFSMFLALTFAVPGPASTQAEWEYMEFDGRGVWDIAFRPGNCDTVYAVGSVPNDIYRSTDRGVTWISADAITGHTATHVAVNTIDKDYVYVACHRAIYRSRDGGGTWDSLFSGHLFDGEEGTTNLAVNPCHPETLYLSTSDPCGCGGLYRSPDSGVTWERVILPQSCPRPSTIGIHPAACWRMYTDLDWEGPLARSYDSGNSWAITGYPGAVEDIDFNPNNPGLMYWCSRRGLQRSADGADTWEQLDEQHGITEDVWTVAVNQVFPEVVYAGGVGVFRSDDYGTTWSEFNEGLPPGAAVSHLAVDTETGSTLLLSARLGVYHLGIYRRIEDYSRVPADETPGEPGKVVLEVSPSPSAGPVSISYSLGEPAAITISIWNTSGRLVRTLVDRHCAARETSITWNGKDSRGQQVAPGIYFILLKAGALKATRPVVVVR